LRLPEWRLDLPYFIRELKGFLFYLGVPRLDYKRET